MELAQDRVHWRALIFAVFLFVLLSDSAVRELVTLLFINILNVFSLYICKNISEVNNSNRSISCLRMTGYVISHPQLEAKCMSVLLTFSFDRGRKRLINSI
jgi:hypothetical protein